MKRLSAILFSSLLGSCSCDEDPGGKDDIGPMPPKGTVAIAIEPPAAVITIDGITRGRQAFTVFALDKDGAKTEVTRDVTFELSNTDLGSMMGAAFDTNLIGGTSTLRARLGTFEAAASIEVIVKRVVIVPGGDPLPPNPGVVVGSAPDDPSRSPTVVYPNDGVLLPTNLGTIEVHFRPGNDNTLFEIAFESPVIQIVVYTRCQPLGAGCVYTTAGDVFSALADSNRGLDPVEVTIRGTDDVGTGRGTSAPIELSFSAVRVDGGLYYWTTDGGRIIRVDFGAGRQPEQFYPFGQNGTCYGCHSISRNGQHMTLSRSGQWDGRLTIIEIGSKSILLQDQDDKREQFQSWDPTSSFFAGVWADGNDPEPTDIRIRDGRTGDVVETIDLSFEPDHPDWSPRGDRIIFTVVTHHQTSQRPGRGGISYVSGGRGAWGGPVELIPPVDGKNFYYPAYAPDASFFIYCESTCPGGETYGDSCDADADPSAKLWAMSSDGGATIYLSRASGPGVEDRRDELSNTFPKWAPFVDPRKKDGTGRVMWFTFSSRRSYGLREPNGSDQWLWMAAIDPDAVARGEDGSYPAFALPFQDLGTSNHIAQWTTTIVPTVPNPTDGGIDPVTGDGGPCAAIGDPCDPSSNACCGGAACSENGPGIYICRPDL